MEHEYYRKGKRDCLLTPIPLISGLPEPQIATQTSGHCAARVILPSVAFSIAEMLVDRPIHEASAEQFVLGAFAIIFELVRLAGHGR